MSDFEVKVRKIDVFPHPNADRLDLAAIDGYRVVVRKGRHQPGDRVVYLPQDSVLPRWLIDRLDLGSKLGGADQNRIRAVNLRGALSQGLVYELEDNRVMRYETHDGAEHIYEPNDTEDVAALLGVEKFEPIIPARMNGELRNSRGRLQTYDIEDVKKHMDWFEPGELVFATEKMHGTQCTFAWDHKNNEFLVASKGRAAAGLSLKINDANAHNVYVQEFHKHKERLEYLRDRYDGQTWYLFGEIYGYGIQDLKYDAPRGETAFAAFDLYVGEPNEGEFIETERFIDMSLITHIPHVPFVWRGHYDYQLLCDLAEKNTQCGPSDQIREGLVVRPMQERKTELGERVIAKFISSRYVTRKGGTEYN